ncbi:hypothetical protein GM418_22535 [Maribellus comscasis]|uniref:NERD domain-containing protein n=1 Tax=Maribellus comscasis TaxID=2681766 RepID=A0A6I6K1A0_9BACT|nr:hypothetical protein [Maribellus comscasis]QGY46337.1 hypothetical protein GM418_22535 [Maribellus comscasis]
MQDSKFNIDIDSAKLKEIISVFDSETFIKHIADIITLIQPPRVPFKPFVGLDSPLMQLLYIASLNISSAKEKAHKDKIEYSDWHEIVKYAIRVKAGYYDALLPEEDDNEIEFYEKYKIVLPVFIDYFNSGSLNFEEQEIEKVISIFSIFDNEIYNQYGLKVLDFIEIYNLIDNNIIQNSNGHIELINKDEETKLFWESLLKQQKNPDEWTYNGDNTNIKKLIDFFNKPYERFVINKSHLQKTYDSDKIDSFFKIFSLEREERNDYKFYTSPIILAQKPIFCVDSDKFIVLDTKQIIHAIYQELTKFCKTSSIEERFYKRRGKYLQDKIVDSLKIYFGNDSAIFNEYKTSKNNKGQDIIALHKGLCLIIEAKAGREPEPRRNADVKESFNTIVQYFKKNLQKAYVQADRVKELFDYNEDFQILDGKNTTLYHVRTKKFHSVFSILITLDKFREPQINLNNLLELNEGDEDYPISICIDDFEVLLLALKKKRISIQKFITYLNYRKKLQGRIQTNDELQIWADFILAKKFKIPDNPNYHYSPSVSGADLFDDLYEQGLGFKHEKFLADKKQARYLTYRNFIKKHYA